MKKVLYIGPYYHTDSFGIASQNIIEDISLNNNCDLYLKPIYINNHFNTTTNKYIALEEKEMPQHFDVIIQHAPYSMMVGKNFLCENTKFIGIPISYLMYGQNIYNLEIMDQFDLICVDSEYSQDIAESIFKYRHKNIQLYNYSNLEENRTSTRINLGISNNTVKIYYIGTLEYNEKIIESIILSFYSASIAIPNISLLLYITDLDGDPEIAKKMDELLNNIKNNIRSKSFNKHFIIKDACTYNLLHMIHNTGDIIINMDISGSSTGLNKHFAKLYGNHIIDYSHIESITKYAQGSLTEFYMLPSEISLYKSIISRISDKNLSDTTTDSNQPKQTIGSIIDNA